VFLSLSVTTYNRKKLSSFCINSINQHTPRKEYELIVVDNGSTDGTVKMLQKFKRQGIIDKLVLKNRNSLGGAINRAWGLSNPKAAWLLAISNDHFCTKGWYENFKAVITSELKPEYLLAVERMPGHGDFVPRKTRNGGSYLVRKRRWRTGFPFGGGLAIKRAIVFKHRIKYPEPIFYARKGSLTAVVCKRAFQMGLRFAALGKPAIMAQDNGFNDPEFKAYYDKRFGITQTDPDAVRRRRKLALLRKRGYIPDPDNYYKGVDYTLGSHSRKALTEYKKQLQKAKE